MFFSCYPAVPRLPLEPLMRRVWCGTENSTRLYLGVSGRQWETLKKRGLPIVNADRLAVKAGLHPAVVWPYWLEAISYDAAAIAEQEAAVKAARAARKLELQRIRRRTRPEVAEKNRAVRRAYYEQNGDYERARQRARSRKGRAA